MAAPFTDADYISTIWRELTSAEMDRAEALIDAASALIRNDAPCDVDALIATGRVDPTVVAYVTAQMVIRVMRNPNAIRQQTVGGESQTYATETLSGTLELTDEDISRLGPGRRKVGTIRLRPALWPCT